MLMASLSVCCHAGNLSSNLGGEDILEIPCYQSIMIMIYTPFYWLLDTYLTTEVFFFSVIVLP